MELKRGYNQTEVGVIPKDWRLATIKDLASITTGKRNTQDRVTDGKYQFFIRSQNVERINSYSFEGEAVLTAGDGVGTGKIFHYINGRFDFHQRVYKISDFSPDLNGFYFYLYFSKNFYARIASMTAKSSVDSVRLAMIANMDIPLPAPEEQAAIAAALRDIDELIGALDQLIAKKRDIKQAAMQQLLTGERRLPGFGTKRGYKQTEGGMIPEDWDVRRLGDIVLDGPKNGYSGRGGKDARGTLALRLTATSSGHLVLSDETVKRLDETIPQQSDLFLKPGDVLIQRSNTLELVGTAAVFEGPSQVYIYPDLMMRLRFREQATAHWIWRYANSLSGRRYFVSTAAGSTGSMPKISGAKLREMPLPFPRVPEQAAIAAVLSDMDAEIAALEARRDKTRALKQAMMQELLTGRTRLV